jgi:hypothetical protein
MAGDDIDIDMRIVSKLCNPYIPICMQGMGVRRGGQEGALAPSPGKK